MKDSEVTMQSKIGRGVHKYIYEIDILVVLYTFTERYLVTFCVSGTPFSKVSQCKKKSFV